jgi:hypothetical protein
MPLERSDPQVASEQLHIDHASNLGTLNSAAGPVTSSVTGRA